MDSRKDTRGLPRDFKTQNEMPLLPADLKGLAFLITLEIFSLEIHKGESISAGFGVLGIMARSALGIGGINRDFKASAFSEEVIAMPEDETNLGITGGIQGRWLLSSTPFAIGQICFLTLAALSTACSECTALAFFVAAPLALSVVGMPSKPQYWAASHGLSLPFLYFLRAWSANWTTRGKKKEQVLTKGCFGPLPPLSTLLTCQILHLYLHNILRFWK
jgi:hypothetical protein